MFLEVVFVEHGVRDKGLKQRRICCQHVLKLLIEIKTETGIYIGNDAVAAFLDCDPSGNAAATKEIQNRRSRIGEWGNETLYQRLWLLRRMPHTLKRIAV